MPGLQRGQSSKVQNPQDLRWSLGPGMSKVSKVLFTDEKGYILESA
jgi:hypothetical protein